MTCSSARGLELAEFTTKRSCCRRAPAKRRSLQDVEEQRAMEQQVACCIAGCGPTGAMLGLLLARAGVNVLVLEKHRDFLPLRDFRGDTIHPSTLEVLLELGLA